MILYHNYQIVDNQIKLQILEDDPELEDFCDAVWISHIFINSLDGKRKIRLQLSLPDGTTPYIEAERDILVTNLLDELVNVGFSMPNDRECVLTLQDLLMRTEADAEVHYYHDRLGFHRGMDGKLHFYGIESFGDSKNKSYHINYESLKPGGSFAEWRDGLADYVEKNPALQIALLISASAPINSLLQQNHVTRETNIYTMVGVSSTGKTISLRCAASVWLNSLTGVNNMNQTENYQYELISRSVGFPSMFDDVSSFSHLDMSSILYSISSSESRGRCNSDGTAKAKNMFSGSVIYTSERTLLSQTNQFRGLYSRVTEFSLNWFATAQEADAVAEIVTQHYGWAWQPLIRVILDGKFKKLRDLYISSCEELKKILAPKDGVEDRQVKKFAVLFTAIPYISEAWDFTLDKPAILEIIKKTFTENMLLAPPAEVLYDRLIDEIVANKSMYPSKGVQYPNLGSAHGEEGVHQAKPCFWISKEHFQNLLGKFGYSDTKIACRILQEAGYLVKFSDNHYYQSHKISGAKIPCCALLKDVPTQEEREKEKQKLEKIKVKEK